MGAIEQSSNQIGQIISVIDEIAFQTNLLDETGQSLSRIARQVNELNSLIAEIASSAAEQASGLAQVNTTVNQMDQVTQQNAAIVEQTTAASHSVTRESEELSALIKRFRVTQDGNAADHRGAARPGVAAPAIDQKAGRVVAGSGAGRPSGHSRGSLSLKQPAEAAWQDF